MISMDFAEAHALPGFRSQWFVKLFQSFMCDDISLRDD
jgi:hypothetical protein